MKIIRQMNRREFLFKAAAAGFAGLSMADALAGERALAQLGVRKITNPGSRITDIVAINHLKRNGMAEKTVLDYVEFLENYHRHPYAKIYRNRMTDERTLISSGLPMSVNGSLITPRFERGAGHWYIGTNLMTGEVRDDGQITVAPVCDQPTGRLEGQESRWKPQLYIGGEARNPVSGPVLRHDLIATGYATNNCIEWNYGGGLKRVVRVIQGRLQERWVFASSPGKDVRIVHNAAGWPLRLGPYAIDKDTEQITKAQFDEAEYPLMVSASDTFYPDADEETSSVDGAAGRSDASGQTWANLRTGFGTTSNDSATSNFLYARTYDVTNWDTLFRFIMLFNTSSITAANDATAATVSVTPKTLYDENGSDIEVNVYSSNPTSNTALVVDDYDINDFGTTAYCDTALAVSDATVDVYMDFAFNSTGVAAIVEDGITKLAARLVKDATGVEPTHGGVGPKRDGFRIYMADNGSYKPKLAVTYEAVAGSGPTAVAGVTSPASVSDVSSPTSVSGVN